ncbi:MAG: hypothetical protein J3Q66DRAFT_445045 [Benniella sp.]|nr:MAG: hypothetical protein J3Q66DRAFT_445045 [Benniella sp.]
MRGGSFKDPDWFGLRSTAHLLEWAKSSFKDLSVYGILMAEISGRRATSTRRHPGRVFPNNGLDYDSLRRSIVKESLADPVVQYVNSIIRSYSHYFNFHDEIPTSVSERQPFADLTWSFLRNAMTITGVETQYLEVQITGVHKRMNLRRDEMTEVKHPGQFADGVATWNGNQICLSEASLIQQAKPDKMKQDEFKLARALRDSWISQVKTMSQHWISKCGLAVYGSSTFNSTTKLWRLECRGVFRLINFDSFLGARKTSASMAKTAILQCLQLATQGGGVCERDG